MGKPLKRIRTTIIINETLLTQSINHVERRKVEGIKDTVTDLVQRALINQLEKEGDFEIRDLIEGETQNAGN